MTKLKIIFFDDINGWDKNILPWDIPDVKIHYFLRSVMTKINILYITILLYLEYKYNERDSTSKIIIFIVIY